MNDFQIKCFLKVADTLNFARAAEDIGVTQPAITHQIRALEEELGTRLFARTTRSVSMTTAGEYFMEYAKQMNNLSDTVMRRFHSHFSFETPTLRIACHDPLELVFFPDILQAMTYKFPGFHPQITTIMNTYVYKLLEDDTVDLVFSYKEPARENIPGAYEELMEVPVMAVVSPDSELADKDELTYEDILNNPVAIIDDKKIVTRLSSYFSDLISRHDLSTLYICENPEICTLLVKSDYGMTILPKNIIPVDPELVHIPIKDAPVLSFGIYYNPKKKDPVLKEFLKLSLSLESYM